MKKNQEKTDLQIVQEDYSKAKEIFGTVTTINSKEDLEMVSDKTKVIKETGKRITELKEKFVGPAKAIINQAREIYDPAIEFCKSAEKQMKDAAKIYLMIQENIRQKKEAKIAQDLEAGKINTDKALNKLEKLPEVQKSVETESSGLQMRKRKVAKIIERDKIPDEFWELNEPMVRKEALAREKAGLPQIPGVIIEEEVDMASN